jgi:MtN3 and saliva related transmembrane protein
VHKTEMQPSKINSIEWIGWISSSILLLTMAKQVFKQWKEQTSQGVSKWLFAGQVSAEVGFIIYSFLLKNWVFFATNLLLLVENLIGLVLVFYHRKKELNQGTPQ